MARPILVFLRKMSLNEVFWFPCSTFGEKSLSERGQLFHQPVQFRYKKHNYGGFVAFGQKAHYQNRSKKKNFSESLVK